MNREQRAKDNRDRIVQQGIDLLSEHGYHGTGLKMILDAVQIPKGSFYNYFSSKEQFVSEIIEEFNGSILEKIDSYIQESDEEPLETIRSIHRKAIETLEQQGCSKGCLIGDLAAEIGGQSELCQLALQKSYRGWQARMIILIDRAKASGTIRQDVASIQLAEIFWNHWEGALLRMKIEGSSQGVRESLDVVLDTLFKPPAQ